MLNDTPDLDIDAPIDYVLTELGRQTLAELGLKPLGFAPVRQCWCGGEDGEHNDEAHAQEQVW